MHARLFVWLTALKMNLLYKIPSLLSVWIIVCIHTQHTNIHAYILTRVHGDLQPWKWICSTIFRLLLFFLQPQPGWPSFSWRATLQPVHMYVCMYKVCVCLCIFTNSLYICTYIYIYIHTLYLQIACIYVHIYIYIYIYTHTHTYAHTLRAHYKSPCMSERVLHTRTHTYTQRSTHTHENTPSVQVQAQTLMLLSWLHLSRPWPSVCVVLCMYTCMYVYTSADTVLTPFEPTMTICMYAFMYVCVYTDTDVFMYVCVCVHTGTDTDVAVLTPFEPTMTICVYAFMYVCMCIYKRRYGCCCLDSI
jgi:hypothetical protein